MGVGAIGNHAAVRTSALLTTLFALWFGLILNVGIALAQTATFTPSDETPQDFPAGAGRDETFYTCTACHNFKLVAAQGMNRAQWDDSISLMVRKHNMPAPETKDREVLLNYLEAAYPPRAPARGGWQNPFSKQ